MNNIALFLTAALIWGSTWLMITFQLGVVSPLVSVIYRFGLASMFLLVYCIIRKRSFKFPLTAHGYIFAQGLLLFGFNYWLTYLGIQEITSALAAILSTSIVYFNVLFLRIFLGDKIRLEVVIGATIGIVGMVLLFMPEIQLQNQAQNTWSGITLVLIGSVFASLGNIISARSQRNKIPVLQSNALGMGYAAILLAFIALLSGNTFTIDWSFSYIGSLLYLTLFGSIIAFGAFLTLVGKIGADKAGYVTLIFPVVAMILSGIFEDYQWTLQSTSGLLIILLGNFVAMGKYKNLAAYKKLTQP